MRRTVLICAFVLLVAVAAASQEEGPFSRLAEFQIKPGKAGDFVELVKKYDKPMVDGLVEEGAVLAWGLDARVIHQEDSATHMLWWVTPNLAGMDKVSAGFAAMDISDEDQERIGQAIVAGKHHDHLTRTILMNVSEGAPSAPAYTGWSFFKVKPGKGGEWRQLFEKYNKPVLDKLVENGTVYGYGIDVEWIHTEDPGWRAMWMMTTSMGALDKVRAAFRAAAQQRSEVEREAIGRMFLEVTEGKDHRDTLWRAIPME